MQQISNYVYCDDFIAGLKLETRFMPNAYYDYPYLIIKKFLAESTCKEISDYTSNASSVEQAKVKTRLLNSIVNPSVDESIRKTVHHKLPKNLLKAYDKSFKMHQASIEDFFRLAITTSTKLQTLEYTKGSFYIKHSDDSNELINEENETIGFVQVAPQRKLSTVLFTTSHAQHKHSGLSFTGGELVFNYLFDADGKQVVFYPEVGDMIIFPSNPIYSHEVLSVEDGYRLTLVQWHNAIVS
ncbi:2OG-Fe(II) oxygenase [Campylobacterota bacterium]